MGRCCLFFVSCSDTSDEFRLRSDRPVQGVSVAEDGQLITRRESARLTVRNGEVLPDPENDILKIAVFNRYQKKRPAVGFIKNFGFIRGAVASSIAYVSMNILVVGADRP